MADRLPLDECLMEYFRARMAAMTAARRQIGIGELDARALLYLIDNPRTRPTRLREHLGVTSAAVSVLVDRLVARGALRRDPDPDDRRASRLSTTIDLETPPWDALARFDRDVRAAVSELPDATTRTAVDAVDAVLSATHRDRRS